MYKRKTIDKFVIKHKVGFDGQWMDLLFDFKTEQECDEKLKSFKSSTGISRKDIVMSPFGWANHYVKAKRRIKIDQ